MATESDWDIVKTEVSDDGYLPQHPLCTALSRLEAEHKRLEERDHVATCATAALKEIRDALGAADDEAAMDAAQRLRADSERMRTKLLGVKGFFLAMAHEADEEKRPTAAALWRMRASKLEEP